MLSFVNVKVQKCNIFNVAIFHVTVVQDQDDKYIAKVMLEIFLLYT